MHMLSNIHINTSPCKQILCHVYNIQCNLKLFVWIWMTIKQMSQAGLILLDKAKGRKMVTWGSSGCVRS